MSDITVRHDPNFNGTTTVVSFPDGSEFTYKLGVIGPRDLVDILKKLGVDVYEMGLENPFPEEGQIYA